jgi:hypothetical protein
VELAIQSKGQKRKGIGIVGARWGCHDLRVSDPNKALLNVEEREFSASVRDAYMRSHC